MSNHKRNNVLFERPYRGKDAVTGLTMDQFAKRVDVSHAPDYAKAAAIKICRSYDIKGECDPAYIANVIVQEARRLA